MVFWRVGDGKGLDQKGGGSQFFSVKSGWFTWGYCRFSRQRTDYVGLAADSVASCHEGKVLGMQAELRRNGQVPVARTSELFELALSQIEKPCLMI